LKSGRLPSDYKGEEQPTPQRKELTMIKKYEWVIEPLGSGDEIEDVDHADTYQEALDRYADDLEMGIHRFGLVCDSGSRSAFFDGTFERSWAYVENGVLPSHFSNASGESTYYVPQKYHRQVEKAGKS
jgi:hypothetical protein